MDGEAVFSLNAVDIVIIVGSLAIVMVVGLWASRRQGKTPRDYFLASGRLPWYIIGTAFVSTSVSSEQIVGTIGAAYDSGMAVANWEWWSMPVYAVLIVVFIPIYLRNRLATVPELLARRFSAACGSVYTYVMLFAYVIVFMVPVLYGGSLTFSRLTGVNMPVVLLVMVAMVAVYTVKGGLMSVVWTDAVQCLMLVGGGLILYFVALGHVPGGWGAMVEANPERFHLYQPADDPVAPFAAIIAGTFGLFIFYSATNQVMVQRVMGARSRWDGIMGIIFAGFINLLRPLVTCFLGLIVYHWVFVMKEAEPLEKMDVAFPFALATFAPGWGLRGVVLAGFIAAVMSTLSALANSTATIFSLDVYQKYLRPDATDKAIVSVGRWTSFAALAIAALLAPTVSRFGGVFQYFQTGVSYIASPLIAVILCGVLWRRANARGAFAGLIVGVGLTAVLLALVVVASFVDKTDSGLSDAIAGAPWLHGFLVAFSGVHWLYIASIQEAIVILVVIAVSLTTAPPPPGQVQPFLWRPAFVWEHTREEQYPWYASLALWFGVFAAVWFYLYWRFW